MTEDKMVEWHHQLDGHEFEQAPGVGDEQGSWRAAVLGFTKSWARLTPWKESYYHFANKDPSSQGYGFSSSHVWM